MFSRCLNKLLWASLLLAGPAMADLQISQGWLRAVPPVSPTMAGYMILTNQGKEPLIITGARSPVAGRAMIHDVVAGEDGTRTMTPVKSLTLAPGQSESLAPGGKHLMLMKLEAVPALGETVEVCLALEDQASKCASLQVRHQAPQKH